MSGGYLGIDISKTKFHAALQVETKRMNKPKVKVFANNLEGWNQLQTWLVQQGATSVHACLEATSTYGEGVAEFLVEQGHTVSIVNPARIKGFAISEKTALENRQSRCSIDSALLYCVASHFVATARQRSQAVTGIAATARSAATDGGARTESARNDSG